MRKLLISSCLLTLSFGLFAETSQKERDRMMRDLDVIEQTFDVKYAPAEWKKSYAGWDLREEIEKAKGEIQTREDVSVKDYQRILLKFFNSTKDYHVTPSFYSTEAALLPFRVKKAADKYFITWSIHPEIRMGDEVISFNRQPIDEAVQEVKRQEYGNWDSDTDQALAEATLTLRIGACGHLVPKGEVQLEVRSKSGKTATFHTRWFYLSEEVPQRAGCDMMCFIPSPFMSFSWQKKLGEDSFFKKEMSTPIYQKTLNAYHRFQKDGLLANGAEPFIGHTLSHLPPLGKMVQKLDNQVFQAYIFEHRDQNIGFLRIPTYSADHFEAQQLEKLISIFEENTDALVIDQLDNGGGSAFYMYAIASMLTDRPLQVPSQRIMLTQDDVVFAVGDISELESISSDEEAVSLIGSNIGGYHVNYDLAQSLVQYGRFIREEWVSGHTFTEPGYLFGLDYLSPHPRARYTKPILLLVNELDFSCADFLPAILQDNKRATILGSKTAGAGGIVEEHSFPNLYGLEEYSYTGSIAERPNRNPIENLGITPDYSYALSERDLQDKYVDYRERILEILDCMIP